MGPYSFLQYARLKFLVTLLRLFVRFAASSALNRDKKLASTFNVRRERISIPSRDSNRSIKADVYSTSELSDVKQPVLVNWHGSGFFSSLLGIDELYCSQLARDTGITIIDADYRKGPETVSPGPLNDAADVLNWVTSQDRFDKARVGVSGFSAGGTIALAMASSPNKDQSPIKIPVAVAIAVYPVTDLSIAPEAKQVPKPKRPSPPFMQHLINDCYAPDKALRKDPRISPSRADPSLFPQTVAIVTCDGDIFEPEASALASKLENGERRVIHRVLQDVHHGFDKGCREGSSDSDRRTEAYALIVEALRESFGL
ncbi:Alpha/Beta hydrolase protein [Phaeosphaeria sp. MPI-PUGE-AT-0046c]|nr:Alpha/Beta hydrolase protein [Phaeosphaeria sp. MPI-PUGE-AT-0046c]